MFPTCFRPVASRRRPPSPTAVRCVAGLAQAPGLVGGRGAWRLQLLEGPAGWGVLQTGALCPNANTTISFSPQPGRAGVCYEINLLGTSSK